MAVGECPKCDGQFASTARTCPHCGHKRTGCVSLGCMALVLLFVGSWIMAAIGGGDGETSSQPAEGTVPVWEQREAIQERLSYLSDLPHVTWWRVDGRVVTIALTDDTERRLDLMAAAAARFASQETGGGRTKVYMVASNLAPPSYRVTPSDRGPVLCSVTAFDGEVIENECAR